MTDVSKKEKSIPKLPSDRFLFENWNCEFCINFYDMYENKDFIKSKIIGWCPSSKVFFEPKEDDRCLAVMLKSGRWCHMAYFCIVDGFDDPSMYDYFDYFNFEGLDRKIIDDYVTQKEWRL